MIFRYNDYKEYVNTWVRAQPKNGYGVYTRMAEHLLTNSVIISQIFKSDRDLKLEQAAKLSEFMNLNTIETDYFLLLVQLARAGSHDLKQILTRQLKEIRSRGQAIKNRIQHRQLTDEDKSVFYSSWYFIGTWLAATVPEFSSMKALAQHFNVPESSLTEVLRFLLDKGLLVKKGPRFDFGTNVIHVPHDSPYASQHHLNWRMKAMQSVDQKKDTNLHYSAPMCMSAELQEKIREEILQFIQKQTKRVTESPSEVLVCLNIDFFKY